MILTQEIKNIINEKIGNNMLNYSFFEIIIILILFFMCKKKNIMNLYLILAIFLINIISYVCNDIDKITILRSIFTFFLPLCILTIEDSKLNVEYLLRKCLRMLQILIYFSLIYSIFQFINGDILYGRRTGGIIGHPLTSAWYYVIYLAMSCIYCKYFNDKDSVSISIDVLISILGITLSSGRIGLTIGIVLSLIYIETCMKSKLIKYILLPLAIICFMFTPIVKELIWNKFSTTINNGDITNGRLWALREMNFFKIFPRIFTGNGIGYSNYISQYLFGTFNFENPIIMFSFDYGILTTVIMLIISIIKPIIKFIINKKYMLVLIFLCIQIVPYTYNGLAESNGLFMLLMFLSKFFSIINYNMQK